MLHKHQFIFPDVKDQSLHDLAPSSLPVFVIIEQPRSEDRAIIKACDNAAEWTSAAARHLGQGDNSSDSEVALAPYHFALVSISTRKMASPLFMILISCKKQARNDTEQDWREYDYPN